VCVCVCVCVRVCVCVGGLVWFVDFGEDMYVPLVTYCTVTLIHEKLPLAFLPCILSLPLLLSPIRLEEKRTLADGNSGRFPKGK
jgi:hypothetical protein